MACVRISYYIKQKKSEIFKALQVQFILRKNQPNPTAIFTNELRNNIKPARAAAKFKTSQALTLSVHFKLHWWLCPPQAVRIFISTDPFLVENIQVFLEYFHGFLTSWDWVTPWAKVTKQKGCLWMCQGSGKNLIPINIFSPIFLTYYCFFTDYFFDLLL